MVVYTSDYLIFSRDGCIIDELVTNLSKTFLLKDQGMIQDYLGIRIAKDTVTKTIFMTQTGLIESIVSDVGLSMDSNNKKLQIAFYTQISRHTKTRYLELSFCYPIT